ncbi:hypothetical protein Tco_0694802 [Tanacetum coccineum]
MEEILAKFIDEGKREHEELEIFIKEFRTTNELLLKERSNLLSELKIEVNEFLKVMGNVLIPKNEVKRVKTRGGKMTSEATVQMPKYAKYLKSLLTNKSKLEEACTVTMNERCSAILLNKLPSKEKDMGNFTIPSQVSHLQINNALENLGASISLMPYTMYEKLGLGEPKPTRMSLKLSDRETFLATARAMIDVFNKKIKLRVGDDEVIFNMDQSIKKPPTKDDECHSIDDTINIETQELLENDQLDLFLLEGLEKSINHSDLESCNSIGDEFDNDSDVDLSIRRIDPIGS